MVVGKDKPITWRDVITVGGFVITICTFVWGASAITSSVTKNTQEIDRVDEKGCEPSFQIRRDLVGVLKDIEKNTLDNARIEDKLDKLIERQDTVVTLLKQMTQ